MMSGSRCRCRRSDRLVGRSVFAISRPGHPTAETSKDAPSSTGQGEGVLGLGAMTARRRRETQNAPRPGGRGAAGFGLGSELSATQTLPCGPFQVTSGGCWWHRRCPDESDKTPSSGLVSRAGGPRPPPPLYPAARRHGPGRPDRRRQQRGRAYSSRNVSHTWPLPRPHSKPSGSSLLHHPHGGRTATKHRRPVPPARQPHPRSPERPAQRWNRDPRDTDHTLAETVNGQRPDGVYQRQNISERAQVTPRGT
jgi:hypothetical protein